MAFIERASPALKQILLKLYSAEKPMEIDHHLHEFGSVEYHILSQASDPLVAYLSISTPPLCPGVLPNELSSYAIGMVKGLCPGVVEIAEPAREGFQLTLRLNLNQIPRGKDYVKVIREISTVQSVILSSQLKEILWNINSDDAVQGMYKPIKLLYNPREPFFVIRQPQRIVAVFPIRFKEKSDVIIATAFFQELVDVGSSDKWAKAPPCTWSAIPPPELRGEAFEDLSTNGGFVSFDISSHHVDGKRLDKTVWNLLNFNAYVRYHVKTTKGFIQRRMRKRMENLVEVQKHECNISSLFEQRLLYRQSWDLSRTVAPKWNHSLLKFQGVSTKKVLHHTNSEINEQTTQHQGCRYTKKLVRSSKYNILKQRWGNFGRKLKRIHFRLKIHGFGRFRQQWLRFPKFSSKGYTKLD